MDETDTYGMPIEAGRAYMAAASVLLDRAEKAEAERATAWDEGYRAAIEDYGCDIPWGGMTSDANPYRATAP